MYDVIYQYFNSISKHETDNILDHGMTTQMGFESWICDFYFVVQCHFLKKDKDQENVFHVLIY